MTSKVLHIAGYESCAFFSRALTVLRGLAVLFPSRLTVVEHTFADRSIYREWLEPFRTTFVSDAAASHSISPFCWTTFPDQTIESYVGSHDDVLDWCRGLVQPAPERHVAKMVNDGHSSDHSFDYDCIVIGGGSGGMACAKECAHFGAKVACLDFVKPSPAGTSWGLGGTCVNVGCIPKKLFHAGALLKQSAETDLAAYGLTVGGLASESNGDEMDMEMQLPDPTVSTHWKVLKDNIQNYIRSLNFKYRVRLREKSVTYLNQLARFVDAHTIECTDKKGRVTTLTSSRFVIATGGRPAPLTCEGSELAISSDDIFSLDQPPGRTLVVGASYIALECAGFLASLGVDVTIAVRSILLRGFDRECVNRIDNYMGDHGVKFRIKVVPTKLERLDDNRIQVTFSDGNVDQYDTVMAAVGRLADTTKLGLQNVGIATNPTNHKIVGEYEQSSCPNIYAVGDVLDGTPELTPVAIQAGILLARRLFNGSTEPMDYQNICTTVFTPIEYSCVGLSEEDALEKYGENNIEVYHREFLPLEWSLSAHRSHTMAFTKAIVEKTTDRVVGIHFVGPDAGEVMQGYGVAMKQGLTYQQLSDTVGIHPTSSEEIVSLAVTKSSGEDAAAGGC